MLAEPLRSPLASHAVAVADHPARAIPERLAILHLLRPQLVAAYSHNSPFREDSYLTVRMVLVALRSMLS